MFSQQHLARSCLLLIAEELLFWQAFAKEILANFISASLCTMMEPQSMKQSIKFLIQLQMFRYELKALVATRKWQWDGKNVFLGVLRKSNRVLDLLQLYRIELSIGIQYFWQIVLSRLKNIFKKELKRLQKLLCSFFLLCSLYCDNITYLTFQATIKTFLFNNTT